MAQDYCTVCGNHIFPSLQPPVEASGDSVFTSVGSDSYIFASSYLLHTLLILRKPFLTSVFSWATATAPRTQIIKSALEEWRFVTDKVGAQAEATSGDGDSQLKLALWPHD